MPGSPEGKIGAKRWEPRGFSRVAAGFLSYNGKFRLPLLLAQGSPVFHSSCEGELGIALESLHQGASRAAPGKSCLHARGKGERVMALE